MRACGIQKAATSRRDPLLADGTLLHVAIEHRLMHAETLAYLLHNLPLERKIPQPAPMQRSSSGTRAATGNDSGGNRNSWAIAPRLEHFGWDNEFETEKIDVPAFFDRHIPGDEWRISGFVQAGGYEDSRYWRPEDWEWKRQQRLEHPHFWLPRSSSAATDPDTQWEYRAMFGTIPLPQSWPVYVSHAEAAAFARWAGKKAAHRSAMAPRRLRHAARNGAAHIRGAMRRPTARAEIFNHERGTRRRWTRIRRERARSAFIDLLGNGWEWTVHAVRPAPGIRAVSFLSRVIRRTSSTASIS